MMFEDKLIFFSYATQDRERVSEYADYISSLGYDVWIDFKRIMPGQNWDLEIKRALSKAVIIIIFVSEQSVNKRGYVQREIKIALDRLDEKLADDIYLIPVLLDDNATVPEQLSGVQFTKASSESCKDDIANAIKIQFERIEQGYQSEYDADTVKWSKYLYKDDWNGIPGYEIEAQFIRLHSAEYNNISEISKIIEGHLLEDISRQRSCILDPAGGIHNFGQIRQRRTNTYLAECANLVVTGKMLSVVYYISTYYAGAAHPNMTHHVFNFMLEPLIIVSDIQDLFASPEDAFLRVQTIARSELKKPQNAIIDNEDSEYMRDPEWVETGTNEWNDFSNFVLRDDCVEFLFDAYQVDSYAAGPQSVEIKYEDLGDILKDVFLCALDKEHIIWQRRDKNVAAEGA